MLQRRAFNIIALLSLAMLLPASIAWAYIVLTHVPEADQIAQHRDAIHEAIENAAYDSPAYHAALQRHHALDVIADDYQMHREAREAAERRRFVVLPLVGLVALSALPLARLLVAGWRWERLPDRASRWLGLYRQLRRTAFAVTAVLSAAFLFVLALMWVRSYFTGDRFQYWKLTGGQGSFYLDANLVVSRGAVSIGYWREISPTPDYYQSVRTMFAMAAQRGPVRQPGFSHTRTLPTPIGAIPQKPTHAFLVANWGIFRSAQGGQMPMQSLFVRALFPLWMPELILLIAPAGYVLLWWKRRNAPIAGHCRKCGYDLTGNTSGVCPECGTGISRAEASGLKTETRTDRASIGRK